MISPTRAIVFRRPKDGPHEYDAVVNGEVVGRLKKYVQTYTGIGLGTYTHWVVEHPTRDRVYLRNMGSFFDQRWAWREGTIREAATKFDTRREASKALLEMQSS